MGDICSEAIIGDIPIDIYYCLDNKFAGSIYEGTTALCSPVSGVVGQEILLEAGEPPTWDGDMYGEEFLHLRRVVPLDM